MELSGHFHIAFAFCLLVGLNALIEKDASTVELDYATSTDGLVRLLNLEKDLIDNFDEQANEIEKKIHAIRLMLSKIRKEHEAAKEDPEVYFFNPLRGYSIIRRMQSDWIKWQEAMKKPVSQAHIDFMNQVRVKLPSEDDYREARAGIHRLHTTYLLSIQDSATGLLLGKQYDGNMSALDCFVMGEYLSDEGEHKASLYWFGASLGTYDDSKELIYEKLGLSFAHTWYRVAEKFFEIDQYNETLEAIDLALEYAPDEQKYISYKSDIEAFIAHDQLCRGDLKQPMKLLHCRYNSTTSPYLKIGPLKMEEISLDPFIVLYHDVIHDNEIEIIKELATPLLKPELFGETSNECTAKFATFENFESALSVQSQFNRRVAVMTGLSTADSEPPYAVNYGMGGHYYNHEMFVPSDQVPRFRPDAGNRFAAVIFNLNDVEQGGATVFPFLDLAIPTKKGTALVLPLLNQTGMGDHRSMIATCPVIVGSSWSLVKFVKEAPQMFRKPCYEE